MDSKVLRVKKFSTVDDLNNFLKNIHPSDFMDLKYSSDRMETFILIYKDYL